MHILIICETNPLTYPTSSKFRLQEKIHVVKGIDKLIIHVVRDSTFIFDVHHVLLISKYLLAVLVKLGKCVGIYTRMILF